MSHYKNIVITGASAGVGRALALRYSCPDVNLCLISRGISASLNEVADLCRAKGAKVTVCNTDVTNVLQMKLASINFIDVVKSVDLVIVNAGIREVEDDLNQDSSIPKRVMDTNFFGALNTIAPFIPLFIEQQNGHFAVISSIAAHRGMPNSGVYSASKAALNLWCESLRLRLSSSNVKVTVISLSFVNTAMTAKLPFWMPGLMSPEVAASKIAEAIQSSRRTIIIPWQSRLIWSALIIMPNVIYEKFILIAKKIGPKRK